MNEPIEQEPPTPDPQEVLRERHKFWIWYALMFFVGVYLFHSMSRRPFDPFSAYEVVGLTIGGAFIATIWAGTFGRHMSYRAYPMGVPFPLFLPVIVPVGLCAWLYRSIRGRLGRS